MVLAVLLAARALALAQIDIEKARNEGEMMLYTSLVPEDLTALAAAFEEEIRLLA